MKISLPRSRATVVLLGGFATFLAALAYLVGSSFVARRAPVFDPTPFGLSRPRPPAGVDTLTVDARDDRAWRFVDLGREVVLAEADSAGWDLTVRRHNIGTSGAIADAGRVPFEAVTTAPAVSDFVTGVGRDTVNAAIRRWYVYGLISHLLGPNGHVYLLRTRTGRYVKLEILSYYCPGLEGGCLTFRYAGLPPS